MVVINATLIKCDGDNGCGEEFRLLQPSVDYLKDGVEKTYFTCPHCGKEYLLFYTNEKTRRMQQKMRRLTNPTKLEGQRKAIARAMVALRKRVEK